MTESDTAVLIDHLTDQGCNWKEIEDVLRQLRDNDKRLFRESVFDSIGSGEFELQAKADEEPKPSKAQ